MDLTYKLFQWQVSVKHRKKSTTIRRWENRETCLNFGTGASADHCSTDIPVHWEPLHFHNLVHQITVVAAYKPGQLWKHTYHHWTILSLQSV